MSNPHIFGQLLLVEVPVVSTLMLAVIGYAFRRLLGTLDEHSDALAEQSRALAVLTSTAPQIEKRLGIVEERITGIRETTAALRGAVDMVLLAAPPARPVPAPR